ncbi:MAG TPA: KamA family radical SAM protein [Anaerolineae bacterium]|nr:KamA family radical SAM protein [Anaerolineae bacterium]
MAISKHDLRYIRSTKQSTARERADELKKHADEFLAAKRYIDTGFSIQEDAQEIKARILDLFNATEDDWQSWRWQLKNRITDAITLAKVIKLTNKEIDQVNRVGKCFRWAISPYYVSLMSPTERWGPIRRQSIPSVLELQGDSGTDDPSGEEYTSPVDAVVRRYPDRLIVNTTNQCATFCRHCQRRRNIGLSDRHTPKGKLQEALAYIKENEEVRDVIITGGDPLMFADKTIEWLLSELHSIDHVEIKRIGTRTLATMPQRITKELCDIIEKYPPVYINTQFNHPREVTPEAAEACDRLIKAGAVISNQAVLLKGVNNDPHVMKVLNHELLKIRVRPYYLFQAKPVRGTAHFITSIKEGLEIMRNLRGYTSGLAIPTYIISAPDGLGKVPVSDINAWEGADGEILLKTWEDKIVNTSYPT